MLKYFKEVFFDFLAPKDITCYICGKDLKKKTKTCICDDCKSKIGFIKFECNKCGRETVGVGYCLSCTSQKYYFDRAISVADYYSGANLLIYRLKKYSQRYLARSMAYFMYCAYINSGINVDMVLSVPILKQLLKQRGFNQSKDLLIHFNKLAKLKDMSFNITQVKVVDYQKNLDSKSRFSASRDKYKLNNAKVFADKNVLIIDDVLTTGATASEIARILKLAGANKVYVLTFASVMLEKDFTLGMEL